MMLQTILIGLVAWSVVAVVVGLGLGAMMRVAGRGDGQLVPVPVRADRSFKKTA
jgi:hypothetical protein